MTTDSSDIEMKEKLAAIEHERWSDWMKYLFGECYMVNNGDMAIPADLVKHWQRQIGTPYKNLQYWEKDSDMEQVDRYWPLVEAMLVEDRIKELETELAKLKGEAK